MTEQRTNQELKTLDFDYDFVAFAERARALIEAAGPVSYTRIIINEFGFAYHFTPDDNNRLWSALLSSGFEKVDVVNRQGGNTRRAIGLVQETDHPSEIGLETEIGGIATSEQVEVIEEDPTIPFDASPNEAPQVDATSTEATDSRVQTPSVPANAKSAASKNHRSKVPSTDDWLAFKAALEAEEGHTSYPAPKRKNQ